MLTDPACRNATCPVDKPRARLADAGGLYPDVTLKAAREGRDAARKTREAGTDPVQARKVERAAAAAKSATTFAAATASRPAGATAVRHLTCTGR